MKISLIFASPKCGLLVRPLNITGDTKNFVQISTIFVSSKEIQICPNSKYSNTKRQTTFWKCQEEENFIVFVSKILHVKTD